MAVSLQRIREKLDADSNKFRAGARNCFLRSPDANFEAGRRRVLSVPFSDLSLKEFIQAGKSFESRAMNDCEARTIYRHVDDLISAIRDDSEAPIDELKAMAIRLTTYLSDVAIPACSLLERFDDAVDLVQYLVERLSDSRHAAVCGCGNEGHEDVFRYLLLGPAISSLVVHYPAN